MSFFQGRAKRKRRGQRQIELRRNPGQGSMARLRRTAAGRSTKKRIFPEAGLRGIQGVQEDELPSASRVPLDNRALCIVYCISISKYR